MNFFTAVFMEEYGIVANKFLKRITIFLFFLSIVIFILTIAAFVFFIFNSEPKIAEIVIFAGLAFSIATFVSATNLLAIVVIGNNTARIRQICKANLNYNKKFEQQAD